MPTKKGLEERIYDAEFLLCLVLRGMSPRGIRKQIEIEYLSKYKSERITRTMKETEPNEPKES
jgi:hypothetical protein